MNANADGLVADLLGQGAPEHVVLLAAREPRALTRADLREAAAAWRDALDRAGLPPGGRVAVVVDDPLVLAAVHLAVMAAGRCGVNLGKVALSDVVGLETLRLGLRADTFGGV
jgi:acyl-coenzyme A synthetase/AMP-(fatty) acid ligase